MPRPQQRRESNPDIERKQLVAIEAELGKGVSAKYGRERVADLQFSAEKRYAMAIFANPDNNYIRDIAAKNPQSVVNAMLDLARLGLSLSPALKQAYLIPWGGKSPRVDAMPSYLGMEQAVLRSGKIKLIQTELVYENDQFRKWTTVEGTKIEHEQARGDRGEFEGGFCLAVYGNGETYVEYMSADEIEACRQAAIRKNTKPGQDAKEPPSWKYFKGEMMKKCIVRRASKHWPTDPHVTRLMEHMDRVDPMDFGTSEEVEVEVTEVLSEQDIDALLAAIPRVPEKQRATWLFRIAQSMGADGIDHLPKAKFEEAKEKLVGAMDKVFPEKTDA